MKRTLLALAAASAFTVQAQELPYTFSVFNEPYAHLEDADTANGTELWDDPSYLIPIGFSMDIMGDITDELLILYPGAQLIPSLPESELSVLMPYGEDIMDVGNDETGSQSPILYKTEGDPGNRIFKMEWQNVGYYDEFANNGTFNNTLSFQMWFYETTHDIEFRYGPNTVKDFAVLHPLGGALVVLARNVNINTGVWEALWLVGGNPADPTITLYNDPDNAPDPSLLLSSLPESGTVFHFDTGIVGVSESFSSSFDFNLFPALVRDQFNLAIGQRATYRILDLSGNLVDSGILNAGTHTLDASALASGMYIVEATSEGTHQVKRFVKE